MIQALETRSQVTIPMLRAGEPIGAMTLGWTEPEAFDEQQIALLQTFADQAVIAIENVRLFKELDARNRDLTEALEQQTATSEILHVISRSQTDVQPVFDAIVESAVRLLGGHTGELTRIAGNQVELAALTSTGDAGNAAFKALFPRPLHAEGTHAEAIRDRAPVNLADAHTDPRLPETLRAAARARGFRSRVVVPMLHHDEAVGAIAVTRREPGGFTQDEIALLRTFADQALIAIENVRLFTELEARNHDLTEALEQKTATGEILRVISSSRTDLQPVMDAVVESAARLCEADAVIFRRDGDFFERVANCGSTPSGPLGERFRLTRGHAGGRAMIDGATLQIPDIQAAQDEFPNAFPVRTGARLRTILAVPLMREGMAIGVIVVRRVEVRAFSPRQVDLLTTFAEQAVIAIENVRLFTELQEKNSALTESLEQQTATSEILRVISQSPTDVQPVFDTIVRNAVRLCGALQGGVYRFDGELVHSVAHDGYTPEQLQQWRATWPKPVTAPSFACQAIKTRSPVRIRDFETAPELALHSPETVANLRARGSRSVLAVPMFRQNEVIGAISLAHREVDTFSDAHLELLKTFADQAVIAVENVRLFKELEARTAELTRSVGELTALGEISQVLSSTLDLETVLTTIVSRAVQLSGLDGGVVFEYDDGTEEFVHRAATETGGTLAEARRTTRVRRGEGMVGQTAITLEPAQVPDITEPGAYDSRLRGNLIESGVRAILAVPMVRE